MTKSVGLSRRTAILAAGSLLLPQSAWAAPTKRPSAASFVDSVGVCVHIGSEPYASRFDRVRELLGASGIRHLRDELRPSNDLSRWRSLSTAFNIRWNILVSPATNTVAEMLSYLEELGVSRVSAVEGQNEGDSEWFMSLPDKGEGWNARVNSYQRDVYQALRVRYPASVVPILSPTVLDWKPADVGRIKAAADFSDIVAIHAYVQRGQEPETPQDYASIDWYLRNMRDGFKPGAPAMVTEAGYNNLVVPSGAAVSEAAAAIYLPRLLLNNFRNGILRTFLYEFMDGGNSPTDPEAHWGLVRYDGTPKPAYAAIRNLLAGLTDPSEGPAATRDVQVTLASPVVDVQNIVFQMRDGSIVLALWRAVRCWDTDAGKDIVIPPRLVTISIAGDAKSVAAMVPNTSAQWQCVELKSGNISVPLADTVVLVKII